MANLGETFDPNTVPADEFEPLPAGKYLSKIVDSELKPTNDGTGERLKLTYEIIDGPLEGRKFFPALNIRNKSEIAQRIGLQTLAKICTATGVGAITETEVLHDIPHYVTLKVQPAKGEYSAKNEIASCSPVSAAPPKPSAGAPAKAAAGGRPWKQ